MYRYSVALVLCAAFTLAGSVGASAANPVSTAQQRQTFLQAEEALSLFSFSR